MNGPFYYRPGSSFCDVMFVRGVFENVMHRGEGRGPKRRNFAWCILWMAPNPKIYTNKSQNLINFPHWKYRYFRTRTNFLWLFILKLSWLSECRHTYTQTENKWVIVSTFQTFFNTMKNKVKKIVKIFEFIKY